MLVFSGTFTPFSASFRIISSLEKRYVQIIYEEKDGTVQVVISTLSMMAKISEKISSSSCSHLLWEVM